MLTEKVVVSEISAATSIQWRLVEFFFLLLILL